MNRHYGIIYYTYYLSLFFITFPENNSSLRYAFKAFKETDVFKDVLRLSHNEGVIYDKPLKL